MAGDGGQVSAGEVGTIDHRTSDGFTLRELLIEAAGVASGEEIPAIKEAAFEMLETFRAPGTPSLTESQVETYLDMISLARDYERAVNLEEPDGFAAESERRTYAMLLRSADLMHAVRHLGTH